MGREELQMFNPNGGNKATTVVSNLNAEWPTMLAGASLATAANVNVHEYKDRFPFANGAYSTYKHKFSSFKCFVASEVNKMPEAERKHYIS